MIWNSIIEDYWFYCYCSDNAEMELSIPAIGMNWNDLGIESEYGPNIYWVETNKRIQAKLGSLLV